MEKKTTTTSRNKPKWTNYITHNNVMYYVGGKKMILFYTVFKMKFIIISITQQIYILFLL